MKATSDNLIWITRLSATGVSQCSLRNYKLTLKHSQFNFKKWKIFEINKKYFCSKTLKGNVSACVIEIINICLLGLFTRRFSQATLFWIALNIFNLYN